MKEKKVHGFFVVWRQITKVQVFRRIACVVERRKKMAFSERNNSIKRQLHRKMEKRKKMRLQKKSTRFEVVITALSDFVRFCSLLTFTFGFSTRSARFYPRQSDFCRCIEIIRFLVRYNFDRLFFRLIKWSVFSIPNLEICQQIWQPISTYGREKRNMVKIMELHALLTHRENVAWQTGEVCTWHFGLVSVALRSMPRTVADRLGRRDACAGHFPWTC